MLKNVQIRENEDAHFSCEVYPDDIPVNWYLDGTQIGPNDKYSMPIKGPKRDLHIKDAAKEDEGRVSVVINDDLKSSADLSVEGTHMSRGQQNSLSHYWPGPSSNTVHSICWPFVSACRIYC